MKNSIDINNPTLHPACLLFPKLTDEELHSLGDDIKENGLHDPIVTLNGEILDGRNRLEACKIAAVEPRFIEWEGEGSPLAWVISKNLMRRNLTASQRAVVAFGLLPLMEAEAKERQRMSKGRGKKGAHSCATSLGKASEHAARIANSSARTIEQVKAIHQRAPELIEEIRTGTINVADATRLSKLGKDERDEVMREPRDSNLRTFTKLQTDHTEETHEPQSEYSTPEWLFDILDNEFHFTLDVAASPENAKCERYFTPDDDGLSQSWGQEIVWCNPPFHRHLIGDWVKKAFEESQNGATVVMLIPSMFKDYRWWKDYCVQGEVRFLHEYVRFNRQGNNSTAYKDVAVVIFGPNVVPGSVVPLRASKVNGDVDDEVPSTDHDDFYPTPEYVTWVLMDAEEFDGMVWEPACGDGTMSRVLLAAGYAVYSSDIIDRGYGEVEDFLESDRQAKCVVTNPPYSLAEEFVKKALDCTAGKVAMFLPLSFLSSKSRFDWLPSTPLKHVHVFTNRVSLYRNGVRGDLASGTTQYAWFVWEHGYQGAPKVRWLPPNATDAA